MTLLKAGLLPDWIKNLDMDAEDHYETPAELTPPGLGDETRSAQELIAQASAAARQERGMQGGGRQAYAASMLNGPPGNFQSPFCLGE